MEFTEQVLVLQVGKFKEADLWVRFLSPTRGVLSAFAFGGSRSRRRFVGCLDVFNEVSVRITGSTRNPYLALQEGVLVKGLERLRTDWARFGVAVNCARFLQSFGIGADGAEKALVLMRETLGLLESAEVVPGHLPLYFRIRMACDHGYALEATACSHCGREHAVTAGQVWLILQEGRIVCSACSRQYTGHKLPLSDEALSLISFVVSRRPQEWAGLPEQPGHALREFARAVDGFIQYHVGIIWDRGRFVKH